MSARSYLYVPGNRPDRFAKAAASGADAVILDLEDAVGPAEKDDARRAVGEWLGSNPAGPRLLVRVNMGDLLEEDLRAIASLSRLDGISIPKATPSSLTTAAKLLEETSIGVVALVESAEGMSDVRGVASSPRVERLAIGEADLAADLGMTPGPDGAEMAPYRAMVVLASVVAGLDAPVGPVSTDFRDLDAFRVWTLALRRAGFGARATIHPAQVPVANEVFTPASDEVATAKAVLAAFEAAGSGVTLDAQGRMLDEAVVRAARRVLRLANAGGS